MEVLSDACSLSQAFLKFQVELSRHLADAKTINRPDDRHDTQYIGRSEPPCVPPGRKNHDANTGTLLIPCPAAGAALNAKYVVPGSQGGVPCDALGRVYLIPLRIQGFELVPIARLCGTGIAQRCKFKREGPPLVRQNK